MDFLYRQVDVARLAGVSAPVVHYHLKKGWIPSPTVAVGRLRFFTEEEKEACLAFYRSRTTGKEEIYNNKEANDLGS